jgi:hypothetical protein
MKKLSAYGYRGDRIEQRYKDLRFDGKLTFNKVTDVYHAAVGHDEDQPVHSARARYEYLFDALCGGVWEPVSAVLSGGGVRDG